MLTQYTVAQFSPDPLAGEAINIGVLAWDSTGLSVNMISDWRRVIAFSNGDIDFLRDFAREMRRLSSAQLSLPTLGNDGTLTPEAFTGIVNRWKNCIQFTPARSSIKSAAFLTDDLTKIFLKTRPQIRHPRRKLGAIKDASNTIAEVLFAKGRTNPESLIFNDFNLNGKLDNHHFDIVVKNGRLISAINTLSFSTRNETELGREIDATAWKLDDVKRVHKKLPLCVLGIHTDNSNIKSFRRAQKIFRGLDAVLLKQPSLKRWADINVG